MKVLFLDVDDVLNNWSTEDEILNSDGTPSLIPNKVPPEAWCGVDEFRIEYIRNIVKKTKCKIVLCSSWRFDEVAVAYLKKRLGEETASQIIDFTPDFREINKSRYEEIDSWLINHPGVNKFVILDNSTNDDLDIFGRAFVQTHTYIGMNEEHMKRVIDILGEEEY